MCVGAWANQISIFKVAATLAVHNGLSENQGSVGVDERKSSDNMDCGNCQS